MICAVNANDFAHMVNDYKELGVISLSEVDSFEMALEIVEATVARTIYNGGFETVIDFSKSKLKEDDFDNAVETFVKLGYIVDAGSRVMKLSWRFND